MGQIIKFSELSKDTWSPKIEELLKTPENYLFTIPEEEIFYYLEHNEGEGSLIELKFSLKDNGITFYNMQRFVLKNISHFKKFMDLAEMPMMLEIFPKQKDIIPLYQLNIHYDDINSERVYHFLVFSYNGTEDNLIYKISLQLIKGNTYVLLYPYERNEGILKQICLPEGHNVFNNFLQIIKRTPTLQNTSLNKQVLTQKDLIKYSNLNQDSFYMKLSPLPVEDYDIFLKYAEVAEITFSHEQMIALINFMEHNFFFADYTKSTDSFYDKRTVLFKEKQYMLEIGQKTTHENIEYYFSIKKEKQLYTRGANKD